MFYLSYFSSLFLFFAGCSTTKHSNESIMIENQTIPSKTNSIPKAFLVNDFSDSPQTTINSAVIKGNSLFLNISYSGGCKEQTFDLEGADFVMKSLPPKRKIKLIRDSKGDACREWITKELVFDIEIFTPEHESNSKIILLLDGYKEEISYIFSSK